MELLALPSELCYRLFLILCLLQQDNVPTLSLCLTRLRFHHLLLYQVETLCLFHQIHKLFVFQRWIYFIFLVLIGGFGRRRLFHFRQLLFQICLFCFVFRVLGFQGRYFLFQVFHQRFPLGEGESQIDVSFSAWAFGSRLQSQELVPQDLQLVLIELTQTLPRTFNLLNLFPELLVRVVFLNLQQRQLFPQRFVMLLTEPQLIFQLHLLSICLM